MDNKDINILKTLWGTLYKTEEYMREEMSEYIIFSWREGEDWPVFRDILHDINELKGDLTKLISKYVKEGK